MKRWLLVLGLLGGALSAPAWAERYWVSWEGNDYPENEGWERQYGNRQGPEQGGALRSLNNGIMTIDSLFDDGVYDFSRIDRPGAFSLAPGEVFVAEWQVRVIATTGPLPYDASFALFSDDDWGLGLNFGVTGFYSAFEHFEFSYQPNLFHSFLLRTDDFRTYTLTLDDNVTLAGVFWEPAVSSSFIAWGDGTQGLASRVDWDYFRFGIVPEPDTLLIFVVFQVGAIWRKR